MSSFGIITSLLGGNVHSIELIQENEDTKTDLIENTVESFFSKYEMAYDNSITAPNIYSEYFVNNISDETELNIAIIDTMLYKRIIIKDECPNDLSELNKNLNFHYNSIDYDDNTANVEVTVTKTFNYPSYPDIESATRDTYDILLTNEQGQWRINQVTNFIDDIMKEEFNEENVDLNNIDSIKNYKDNILDNVKNYFHETLSNGVLTQKENYSVNSISYNGTAASNYALDHALNYNTNYADFTPYGGDCTNFVSQCIYAGGIPMHYGSAYTSNCWYYTNLSNRSSSWSGVDELYDYIFSSNSQINANLSNWSSVGYGDIIQLTNGSGAYHSLIITGIQYSSYGKSDLLVCAHTADRRHVSLASYYSGATKRYIDIVGTK